MEDGEEGRARRLDESGELEARARRVYYYGYHSFTSRETRERRRRDVPAIDSSRSTGARVFRRLDAARLDGDVGYDC